ncbi:DUF2948 family protein [Sphingoaurantiacus capsulatus]|uniref:DUF2948 family protein n=1 Tax=Sphingoaurantiacus capsulatus TaxID=1771310 RepID=A0ABV7X8N7_9SPHN
MSERLRLIGHEADDLPVISALMQDAAVRVDDIAFDAKARRFALVANRYRWEADVPSRTRSALRFDGVAKAQRKGWPVAGDTVLALLAIRPEEGGVTLDFAGGASVRLEAECIDVVLEDLAGPWGTRSTPNHDD